MAARQSRPGLIVLDRDGVINEDSESFVKSASEWIPLPGSIAAIAALSKGGFRVAVASNQSGLARGLFDRRALDSMHKKLRRLVAAAGGRVDRIVVCPHGPNDGCRCRKPKPGLLVRLGRYFNVPLNELVFVGDSKRDLETALAVDATPILVRTGNGRRTEASLDGVLAGVPVFDDLAAVARHLLTG